MEKKKTNHLEAQRYVGLRITAPTEAEALELYKRMEFPNRYFYAFHNADAGCKHSHVHFAIVRDWDPTIGVDSNSKQLRRKHISKSGLSGNKDFALSFHTNTLIEAGNYMVHEPDAVVKFSEGEWDGFDKYEFQYVEYKTKEAKPDTDIEKRRRDMDAIPLSRYNLVATMQRMDRIRKRPKRSFRECIMEVLTTTRYRLNKELLSMDHHEMRPYIEEYERGVREASVRWLDRVCPQ